MRGAVAVLLVLVALGVPTSIRTVSGADCGRLDYPDAGNVADEFVVDRTLWNELVSSEGFANGTSGDGRVSVFVAAATKNFTVTLEESIVVEYVGGAATNRTTILLRIHVEERSGGGSDRVFPAVSLGGRAGGNLTLVARPDGEGVTVFWRWAYLSCDETFPNSYYVFHAALNGSGTPEGNELVYFEAPRPRRSPPLDLILLVVAGIAVSVIFLLARHALGRKP